MNQTNQNEVGYDGIVESMPRVFRIEPSWLCNLRCICCPTGTQPAVGRGIMTMQTFESIIAEVKKHNPKVVVFYHGGEPFLNKDVFTMIKLVKEAGVPFIKTVSNGMMITPEMLPEIVESGLDSIEFSLDGNSAEENNAIRRGSDYAKVSQMIKELVATKKRLGSEKPSIFIANTQIPTEQELAEGKCKPPEFMEKDFAGYEGEVQFKVNYTIFWPGLALDSSKHKLVADNSKTEASNYCDHPLSTVTFRWNGDVVACCYDITSTYVLGNITREPLEKIWNNEGYVKLRKSIHEKKFLPLCENCHVVKPFLWIARK